MPLRMGAAGAPCPAWFSSSVLGPSPWAFLGPPGLPSVSSFASSLAVLVVASFLLLFSWMVPTASTRWGGSGSPCGLPLYLLAASARDAHGSRGLLLWPLWWLMLCGDRARAMLIGRGRYLSGLLLCPCWLWGRSRLRLRLAFGLGLRLDRCLHLPWPSPLLGSSSCCPGLRWRRWPC